MHHHHHHHYYSNFTAWWLNQRRFQRCSILICFLSKKCIFIITQASFILNQCVKVKTIKLFESNVALKIPWPNHCKLLPYLFVAAIFSFATDLTIYKYNVHEFILKNLIVLSEFHRLTIVFFHYMYIFLAFFIFSFLMLN